MPPDHMHADTARHQPLGRTLRSAANSRFPFAAAPPRPTTFAQTCPGASVRASEPRVRQANPTLDAIGGPWLSGQSG